MSTPGSFAGEPRAAARRSRTLHGAFGAAASALLACASLAAASSNPYVPVAGDAEAHSSNIALSPRGDRLFAANHEADSVSIFAVQQGGASLKRLAEIPVGREPSCVAVRDSDEAFVTNSADGTVSVLGPGGVTRSFAVGAEPRGCALTPDGRWLFVALRTSGVVAQIDARSYRVSELIPVGGNPGAIAIIGRRVFVTDFFARVIPGGPGEGFDDGKQGVLASFDIGDGGLREAALSPLQDSGFTANRAQLCSKVNSNAANDTFCPDRTISDPANPVLAKDPQAVFPNQLASAAICGTRLYLPSIGAQPEPPVFFNTNVQALVHVVDVVNRKELPALTTNLNAQIAREAAPANPTQSLQRLFGNDVVAIDTARDCRSLFVVSRGGNYVLKVNVRADGKLDIGAPGAVVRYPTGNIPTGIAVHPNGKRAYVNNEIDLSVSVLDLEASGAAPTDVPSSTPPAIGTFENTRLLGKLVFFTALGVPDNGLVDKQPRQIKALAFRGKQSDSAWSTCASCHPDGLADGVTWIFPDGPRQSIPLDGLYSKRNGAHDTRINNWSAARDSVTDFNNNSRAVQCGAGFAGGDPLTSCNPASPGKAPNPNVFDHGIAHGASEALDAETTWAQTVRAPRMPRMGSEAQRSAGAAIFEQQCASCHGGAKWTKSEVLYLSDPALNKAFAAGGTPRDPGLTMIANQAVSYADSRVDGKVLKLLEDVGTLNAASPIEIKQNGLLSLGALGFNVPSLIGVGYHAPYLHNGSAQTLPDVFGVHRLPGGGTIASDLGEAERDALELFLLSIDGGTPTFRSETDGFREPLP